MAFKATNPDQETGVTRELCRWVKNINFEDIPEDKRTRAKYLILDGLCCAIVGARLPWTEKAAKAVYHMESPGHCPIWGWEKKLGPLPAALLNSTAIQSFEIDDWHSLAPLHSNSILLPALFAATSHEKATKGVNFHGKLFLLSTITGYETGPRVGLGLYGADMLTRGWHSGPIFGHAASAVAVSKLIGLSVDSIEDALGIACTQACGLMAAQFSSEVKRMQHGFAARNGLFAALMAEGEYTGIKRVFEEPYGGFLSAFGAGSGKDPLYKPEEVVKDLGQTWQLDMIRVKPHASMAGTHCAIDCVAELQKKYPVKMAQIGAITRITAEMSKPAFKHGGWKAKRPLTETGAQMSVSYVMAVQIIHGQVSPSEFHHNLLNRSDRWELIDKTECIHTPELGEGYQQRVTVTFNDGTVLTQTLDAPRGVEPPLSNDEILSKWRMFTHGLLDDGRRDQIEKLVLNIENLNDITVLQDLLADRTVSPFA